MAFLAAWTLGLMLAATPAPEARAVAPAEALVAAAFEQATPAFEQATPATSGEAWPQPGQVVLLALAAAGLLVLLVTNRRLALELLSWAIFFLKRGAPRRPHRRGFSGGRMGGAGASGSW